MGFGFLFLSLLQGIIWQCFYGLTVSPQEDKITCSIPPVEPSHDTVLTCHFPEDLSATRKDFTIYHYVKNNNPEPVVDCWWLNGAIDCYTKPGFAYDKVVSRTLNVTVSHVTTATGKFACQVVGYASRLLETCEFIFKHDDKVRCTIPPVKPLDDTTLRCYFPEDLSVTKKDFTVYYYLEHGNPESVVDCWWVNGAMDCYTKPGYTYDKVVSRTLNVTVSHVTKATGKYACQVAGYAFNLLETCQLTVKHGENNTCNISKEESVSQGILTCFFNEDIKRTQRNFTVYKHRDLEKRSVIHCWWSNGRASCHVTQNYHFNKEVSSYLQVEIPNTRNDIEGVYSCWHDGSKADRVETCSFDTDCASKKASQTISPSVIGSSIAVLIIVIALTVGFIIMFKRLRPCVTSVSPVHELLPKTKELTVFEPFNTYPEINDLLDEPRVFLVGLPHIERTRILCQIGMKWITEGHIVYLINTNNATNASTTRLQEMMQQQLGSQTQGSPTHAAVIPLLCSIDDDKKIAKAIDILVKYSKGNLLFALVDDLDPGTREQADKVSTFLTKLYKRLQHLHLWAASHRSDISPPGWRGKPLPKYDSCPPPGTQRAEQTDGPDSSKDSDDSCLSASDGQP